MTYDNTDDNDDGTVEAPVNNQSVDTDALSGVYDYIVSPDDDLNDIINNQLSAGESVWVGDGEHTVTKSGDVALPITQDDVTVAGTGTIVLEDSASGTTGTDAHAVLSIGLAGGASPDGVTIKDVTVDGNKANNSNDAHAIGVFGATNYRIDNTECRNATDGGIKHDGNDPAGDGGAIIGNEVHNCLKDGIFIGGKCVGRGNYVHDLPNQDGIEPLGDGQTWENNLVVNTAGSAFDCYGVQGVTLTGNICILGDNGGDGISFNGPDSSNQATGCVASGNILITPAGSSNVNGHFNGSGSAEGCEFVDNISIRGGIVNLSSDVKLKDNIFYKPTQNSTIRVRNTSRAVVEDNTIFAPSTHGIIVKSTASGVEVKGNRVVDAGGTSIRAVDGSPNLKITWNQCHNQAYAGIAVSGGTGCSVTDNTVQNGDREGILIRNCDNIQVRDNITVGNSYGGVILDENDDNTHSKVTIAGHQSDGDQWGIAVYEGTGSWDHVMLESNQITTPQNSEYDITVSGVLFRNGTEFVSAAPSDSDYLKTDAGRRVIDESTSPPTEYYIDSAGSAVSL